MSNLSGEHGGITFDHGKFDTDAQITLYWDTLKEKKDKEVLSDGIYKVDAKMLKTNGMQNLLRMAWRLKMNHLYCLHDLLHQSNQH